MKKCILKLISINLIPLIVLSGFSIDVFAQANSKNDPLTQSELNQCSKVDYKEAKDELDLLISKIQSLYDDTIFLEAFEESQVHWEKQLLLDLKMRFPEASKGIYGSIFPVCYYSNLEKLIRERISFLTEWANGHEDGEMCSGSVLHEYYIDDSRKIEEDY
ncbi:lysozyme inhibitor LprI family protein [Marinomonas fungiae]|uniref:Lysozyme inhibitor LprI-like N-terminal domain-containing protein n=1 Tax=Marinomonas fungiae TaxID=1137284 RepID=A0A0K6ILV1_9GAMM|nr:lysozyme inhibitor LprI family protein [Marinomonas fungiae]CUB04080.1 Protein of unknown function (DUF1311) [Marinomonas fungiae]